MKIDILSVPVDAVSFDQAVEQIIAFTKDEGSHYVVTANPEMVVEAQKNLAFREALQHANLVVPDGVGLLPIAHFLSQNEAENRGKIPLLAQLITLLLRTFSNQNSFKPLNQTVNGVDLVQALCKRAQTEDIAVIFLGGNPGEAEKAKEMIQRQFPSLTIMSDAGARNIAQESDVEWERVRNLVASQQSPVLLFIAYGHPKQELWIAKHLRELPNTTAMGVGGTFTYIGQTKKRAPVLLRRIGLEWLWRLASEPSRFKRIYTASIYFPYLAYKSALENR